MSANTASQLPGPQALTGDTPATPAAPAEPGGDPLPRAEALPGLPGTLTARARTLTGAVRRRLTTLAEIESPSGDAERLNQLAEELATGYRATGATVRREPGRPATTCCWSGRASTRTCRTCCSSATTTPSGRPAPWPTGRCRSTTAC